MHAIQFLIVAFVLFALSRAILRFKEGRLPAGWLAAWAVFWLAVGGAALLPQTTTLLAAALGVGRGVDAVLYLSIPALFYIVFRLLVKIEKIEHEITLLVRELSLRPHDPDDQEKGLRHRPDA
jgi:hypothetical protein